jgi:hypothetical protein
MVCTEKENAYRVAVGHLDGERHLEDLRVDERILKYTLNS